MSISEWLCRLFIESKAFNFLSILTITGPHIFMCFMLDGEVKIDVSGSDPVPIGVYGKMKKKTVKRR